jgi:hypothetical protein
MSVQLDMVPQPNPGVVGRVVDNEAVLVLPNLGKVKVLNEVGARIWALADGKRSLRQIAAQLCAEYQVEQAQAEADTLAFAAELANRGVLTLNA